MNDLQELRAAWSGTRALRAMFWLVCAGLVLALSGLLVGFLEPSWLLLPLATGTGLALLASVAGGILQARETRRKRAADPEWVAPAKTQKARGTFILAACSPAIVWLSFGFVAAKKGGEVVDPPLFILWALSGMAVVVALVAGLLWRKWALEDAAKA